MSSSRVYVGGLRPDITERELEEEVRVPLAGRQQRRQRHGLWFALDTQVVF